MISETVYDKGNTAYIIDRLTDFPRIDVSVRPSEPDMPPNSWLAITPNNAELIASLCREVIR